MRLTVLHLIPSSGDAGHGLIDFETAQGRLLTMRVENP